MAVRLLVSDVDGTLVGGDKSLADATVAAAKRLIASGVAMTIISARPPSGMRWIAERIGLDGPMGAFNGATMFHADGSIDDAHHIDAELGGRLLALFAERAPMHWLFADGEWLSSTAQDPHIDREIKSANVHPVLGADMAARLPRADKLVAVSDDHALLKEIEEQAKAIAGDRATIVRSQPYYLDVTAPEGNKGFGIAALAKAYRVDLADTVAVGDQFNDVAMFARAGRSIAMGNAPDEVKAKARETTASNDEDGIAHAIERLLAETAR